MVLGKLPVSGHPTIWMTVGQGPIVLAVCAGGGCLGIFTLVDPFSPLSPALWETAQYRLKYYLKGSLDPQQPTNHNIWFRREIRKIIIKYSLLSSAGHQPHLGNHFPVRYQCWDQTQDPEMTIERHN